MRSGSSGSGGSNSNGWRAAAAAPLNKYEFDFGNLGSGYGGRSTLGTLKQEVSSTHNHSHQQLQQQQQSQAPSRIQPNQKWVHQPATGALGGSSMVGDITGKSWVPMERTQNPNLNPSLKPSVATSSGVVGGVGSSKSDLFSDLFNASGFNKASKTPISQPKSTSTPISMSSVASALPMNQMKNTSAANSHPEDDFFGSFSSSSASSARAPPAAVPPPPPPPKPQTDPLEDLWRKIPPPRQPVVATTTTTTVKTTPKGGGASSSSGNFMEGLEAWEGEAVEESSGGGATTELEGLPPPPAGFTGSSAKEKGIEFQKQGQFADAIKWLSWSLVLLGSDDAAVLSCRVSCYKEVGEYKKAVEDCCKILEKNSGDTEALLQRAFLYESMEKYKLSVEDLREVLKRDPSNRLARNTLSRLSKLVD